MPNPLAQVGAGKNFVRLSNWSRGEHRKSDVYDTPEGWANALKNWYLTDDGSLIVRRGTTRWNATSMGSGAIRGSVRAYPLWGVVATDNFNRADNDSLGSGWTEVEDTTNRIAISSNQLRFVGEATKISYAKRTDAYNDDQYAKLTYKTSGGNAATGVIVRAGGTTVTNLDGYVLYYDFGVTTISLYRYVAGAATLLGTYSVTLVSGNTMRLDVIGSDLTAYVNDAVVITATDSSVTTGVAGVYVGVGNTGGQDWDTFEAGNLGAGTPFFVVCHGTTIKVGTDSTKTFANSRTGLSSTASFCFTQYLNYLYASNGVDAHQKMDVNTQTWLPWGIAAPTAACASAAGAAGSLAGTYRFKYTYVLASGAESNPSPVSTPDLTVASKKIDLTSITVGSSGTASRKVYGFKVGVSSVYQLIDTISDNSTTVLVVTTDQDAWTTEVKTDNGAPPLRAWISALWKGRLLMAGDPDNPKRWYFSKVFVPSTLLEAFPTANFLDIPLGDGDEITAIVPSGDIVYVFGNDKVFYVSGDSELTFAYHETYATAGCPGPWAVDKVALPGSDEVVVFLSRNGLQTMSGLQSVVISEPEEPLFSGLPKQSAGVMNYAHADKATVKFYDKLKAVLISFPVGTSTTNNFMLWWFVGKGFVQDSRSARQFLVLTTNDNDGKAYAWDAADGILREIDVVDTYADDGVPIEAVIDTGYVSGGQYVQELSKLWQWLTFVTSSAPVSATVTVSVDEAADQYGLGDQSETFIMNTNRDERVGMTGRRLRVAVAFWVSAFFRLSEIAARFTSRRTWRPR